jgi:hypothetical protein
MENSLPQAVDVNIFLDKIEKQTRLLQFILTVYALACIAFITYKLITLRSSL